MGVNNSVGMNGSPLALLALRRFQSLITINRPRLMLARVGDTSLVGMAVMRRWDGEGREKGKE